MPIQNAIWKVGATPEALTVSKLATEKDLEDRDERRTSNIELPTLNIEVKRRMLDAAWPAGEDELRRDRRLAGARAGRFEAGSGKAAEQAAAVPRSKTFPMKLKFKHQAYQADAVRAVVDCFQG
ncbi:MAG: hypothetical protein RLZZ398_1983 [Verrucomicrobiota bacterium]|jgi:hypothetical protein